MTSGQSLLCLHSAGGGLAVGFLVSYQVGFQIKCNVGAPGVCEEEAEFKARGRYVKKAAWIKGQMSTVLAGCIINNQLIQCSCSMSETE
ncbi:hypothetical protein SRHO_G00262370 [Serrasalmus rhombeus]